MATFQNINPDAFIDQFITKLENAGFTNQGGNNKGSNKSTGKKSNLNSNNKNNKVFGNFISSIRNITWGLRNIASLTKNILDPWGKVDQAAANFSKNIGLSSKGMEQLRKSAIRLTKEAKLGALFNVSADELLKMQEDYVKAIGRNITVGKEGLTNLAASKNIENATEMMTRMEHFGISMKDAGDRVGQIYSNASKKGIAWSKMSKMIVDNFDMAQKYTFDGGLRSFTKMAQKAAAINLSMGQAASFSEKVNNLEGAIGTAASLQVLGGPFTQFANPMQMLYEGLNDTEKLQDRIVNMFGSLGSYNKLTGETTINGFDRMRIRKASEAAGLDYSNIMEMVLSKGRQNQIGKALSENPNGLSNSVVELIKNIGVIENGQAGVYDANGNFIKAQNITNRQAEELQKIQQSESDDIKQIAATLRGWDDSFSGLNKQKDAVVSNFIENHNIGTGVKSLIQGVSENNRLLGILAGIQIGSSVIGTLSSFRGGFGGVGGPFSAIKAARAQAASINERMSAGRLTNISKWAKGRSIGKAVLKRGAGTGIASGLISGGITGYEELFGEKGKKHSTERKLGRIGGSALGGGLGSVGGAILGGAIVGALTGGFGAGAGAAIGASLGGWGGSEAGKLLGGNDWRRNKFRDKFGLNSLNGDYSVRELKEIKAALDGNGQISEKLQTKLAEKGDEAAIARLEDIKKNIFKVQVVNSEKRASGGIISGPGTGISDSIPAWLSNGESVMTAKATKMFGPELSIMNKLSGGSGNFGPAPIKPNVMKLNSGMIDVKAPSPSSYSVSSNSGTIGGRVDINFSPIKIEMPNGVNKDITNDLVSNPVFLRDLTRKIEEGLLRSGNGGYLIVKQGQKYV